jgi:hypothetical protein
MKRTIIGLLAVVSFLLLLIGPSQAATIDITNGGMEVTGPNTMRLHNVLSNGNYYYVDFEWRPRRNIWAATGYGLETTFDTSAYWLLKQGSTWTYLLSGGGTEVLTVNGTQDVCGLTCIRLDSSDGTLTYWINDDTGLFMTRYVFPDGIYNEWCTPEKIAPAQTYPGSQSLNTFEGVMGSPYGVFATMTGWTQFTAKAVEDVTVPAGTFTDCVHAAFVMSYNESANGGFGFRVEEVWLAKDVGLVKRIKSETFCIGGYIYNNSAETYLLQSYSIPQ